MKITWFGHSCFRIETGSSVLLIDPFLKGNPTFEKSGVAWDAATNGVTHVALTHGHDDHIGDAGEICSKNGATLLAVFELAQHVAKMGAEKLEPMNTGGTVRTGDFDLTLTNALHSSSSGGVYLGNPCGIVLRTKEGKTVYHMGDTDVFSGMELINELYQPTIGIVPIGDRFTMGGAVAGVTWTSSPKGHWAPVLAVSCPALPPSAGSARLIADRLPAAEQKVTSRRPSCRARVSGI